VVALLSRPHTGTWDDKIEYAILDLTENIGDGVHRIYIIKAADVVYLPQVEKLPGEDAMIRSAMDNYVNIILSSDYSVRANKSTQNAYPPKGVYSPVKSVAAALEESPTPSINSTTVVEADTGTSNDSDGSPSDDSDSDASDFAPGRGKKRQRRQTIPKGDKKKGKLSQKKRKADESLGSVPIKKAKSDDTEKIVLDILDSDWKLSKHSYTTWRQFFDKLVGDEVCPFNLFKTIKYVA
jgi:hypothetical protein